MGMNPDTNRFENLKTIDDIKSELIERAKILEATNLGKLLRPNGEPVPDHWSVFKVDEEVVIKNYTFKVAYIGESTLLLEPVGVPIIGEDD